MGRLRRAILLALGLFLFGICALAADVPLPSDGTEIILAGGSAGATATWDVQNIGGTSNGLPTGGRCIQSPGLAIEDGALDSQRNAFDFGLTLWVDNAIFVAPSPVDVTGQTLTAGPVVMSALNVTMQYRAVIASPTLRTLASFQNPTGSPITVDVKWVTNVGSDSATGVRGTSSGDTTFTTADRWVVTSDDATTPGEPVNTFVLFGPDSPAVTSSSVSQNVPACPCGLCNEGIVAAYSLTVPAGTTRALLFFNQLNVTNAGALAAAATFDTTPASGSDLLGGLSAAQLASVVNWVFGAPPPAPALSVWGVVALSAVLSGLLVRRRTSAR